MFSSDKTKIDQIYDSDSINADRDSGDTWNITGLWKAVEDIWGGSNSLFSPPKGTASKGIKPIWDKLNNHEGRISTLETDDVNHDGRIKKLEQDTKDLKNPLNGTSGGTSGSGSEYTGGAPSGGFYGSKYINLANGFIMQYGHYMHSNGEFMETFKLPKPFPTEFCSVVGNIETYTSNSVNYTVAIIDNATFGFYCDDGGNHPFCWIAIGH